MDTCSKSAAEIDKNVECEVCLMQLHAKCQKISKSSSKAQQDSNHLSLYSNYCNIVAGNMSSTITTMKAGQDNPKKKSGKLKIGVKEMKKKFTKQQARQIITSIKTAT